MPVAIISQCVPGFASIEASSQAAVNSSGRYA